MGDYRIKFICPHCPQPVQFECDQFTELTAHFETVHRAAYRERVAAGVARVLGTEQHVFLEPAWLQESAEQF